MTFGRTKKRWMGVCQRRLASIDNPNELIKAATKLHDRNVATLYPSILRFHIFICPDSMIDGRRVLGFYPAERDVHGLLQAQRKRATRPRVKVGDRAEPLRKIIEGLVSKPELRGLSAKEIWPHFSAQLRDIGCDPIESADGSKLSYEFGTGRRRMTFKTFRNAIATIRRSRAQ
ncbi:hypothetical protein [Bradyrhizobium sp. USDA 4449]